MRPVVYDAGALIAADRNDRRMWAEHRVRLEAGIAPVVPTAVVAQVGRSAKQAQLRRLLVGCEVIELREADAHEVGRLLAASKTSDVVDGIVVHQAIERNADIVTRDPSDLSKIAAAARARLKLLAV